MGGGALDHHFHAIEALVAARRTRSVALLCMRRGALQRLADLLAQLFAAVAQLVAARPRKARQIGYAALARYAHDRGLVQRRKLNHDGVTPTVFHAAPMALCAALLAPKRLAAFSTLSCAKARKSASWRSRLSRTVSYQTCPAVSHAG